MYKFTDRIFNLCNKAVVVAGAARSGTTILGKILHSCHDVVYDFEPPILLSLVPLINFMDESSWKLLYETYIYEDLLMNTLAGRKMNFNREDDSSIYKVKPQEYIESKTARSIRKKDCESLANDTFTVYKIPYISPYLPKIQEYYSGTTVVYIFRKPMDVINSLIKKEWFTDENLRSGNITYPYRYYNEIQVPFFVEQGHEELWCEMDHINRAAYSYIKGYEKINEVNNKLILKYEDFVDNPFETIDGLLEKLQITKGEKTDEILKSVRLINRSEDLSPLKSLLPINKRGIEDICLKYNYKLG